MAETTARKQRGKPFEPGQSGNPAGRPPGSRHKSTLAAMALLDGESEALTRKAIDAALGGDMTALKLCLDRIVPLPPAKDRPVNITLPEITNAADLPKITGALLTAVAGGQLGPTEAATLAKLVEVHRGALETADITARIQKLEEQVKK